MLFAVATIARIYHDRADTEHFELLFDGLLKMILDVTGKPLGFKRFTKGGNIKVFNTDMEAAQILGISKSLLKSLLLDPLFKIDGRVQALNHEMLTRYFVRLCITHVKRYGSWLLLRRLLLRLKMYSAILDFKSMVSTEDYQRILNFPHLKTRQELEAFTAHIKKLGVKKISGQYSTLAFTTLLTMSGVQIGGATRSCTCGLFLAFLRTRPRF
jgi:hypothetical protein